MITRAVPLPLAPSRNDSQHPGKKPYLLRAFSLGPALKQRDRGAARIRRDAGIRRQLGHGNIAQVRAKNSSETDAKVHLGAAAGSHLPPTDAVLRPRSGLPVNQIFDNRWVGSRRVTRCLTCIISSRLFSTCVHLRLACVCISQGFNSGSKKVHSSRILPAIATVAITSDSAAACQVDQGRCAATWRRATI